MAILYEKSKMLDKLMLPVLPLRNSIISACLEVLTFALIEALGTTMLPKLGGKLMSIPALLR